MIYKYFIDELFKAQKRKSDIVSKYNEDILNENTLIRELLYEVGVDLPIQKCSNFAHGLTARIKMLHANIKTAKTKDEKQERIDSFNEDISMYIEKKLGKNK